MLVGMCVMYMIYISMCEFDTCLLFDVLNKQFYYTHTYIRTHALFLQTSNESIIT